MRNASAAGPGANQAPGSNPNLPSLATNCMRCKAQLKIVDNLPPATDVAQSFRGNVGESFVVVKESRPDEFIEPRQGGGLPNAAVKPDGGQARVASFDEVSRIEHIIALASGQGEQEHPVCGDCMRVVIEEVQRQVNQAEEEHRTYQEAHDRLQQELQTLGAGQAAALEAEIADLEAEERRLLDELASCDREEGDLKEELERHRRLEEQRQREEDEFWLGVAEYQLDLEESEEERAATAEAIRYATTELNRLKRTNVLNDMFRIAEEGPFGTINRFRIGRLPDTKVPWDEINAAWGQACLLLDALVKKCGAPMTSYRLLPRGSYSAIQVNGEVFELYGSDGGLARFFTGRRFDLAMSAFLECLKEVARFLATKDPLFRLPFKIEGDKVGTFSVRIQFNQEEKWTKAMKFMLVCLKWLVVFVESHDFSAADKIQRAGAVGTAAATATTR